MISGGPNSCIRIAFIEFSFLIAALLRRPPIIVVPQGVPCPWADENWRHEDSFSGAECRQFCSSGLTFLVYQSVQNGLPEGNKNRISLHGQLNRIFITPPCPLNQTTGDSYTMVTSCAASARRSSVGLSFVTPGKPGSEGTSVRFVG